MENYNAEITEEKDEAAKDNDSASKEIVNDINKSEESGEKENKEPEKKKRRKPDKKTVRGFVCGAAAAAIVIALVFALYMKIPLSLGVSSPSDLSSYKKITEIVSIIEKNYMGDIDEELMADYMYLGLVSGLDDKYSTYYTKEEYEQITTKQQGNYTGIGVTISVRTDDGAIEILEVTEDGPADEAGVLAGDVILAVNGKEVSGMTSSEVSSIISGAESDDIVLKLYREDTDEELEITVTRGLIESVIVWGGVINDNIGYIAIDSFTAVTATQFTQLLEELYEYDIEGLILDLRDNSGGLVSAACDMLREFIPEGVLVYTEDKNGSRSEYTSESGNEIELPVVVIVNEYTASASEIMVGALQDYGVAVVVGAQTFGKGIIQDVFKLSDGSVIRLTVSHYYTPNGNNIHGVGVTPDIEVEYNTDDGTDSQLEAAIEALGL